MRPAPPALAGLLLAASLPFAAGPALAQVPCEDWVAETVSLQGAVQARRAGEAAWTPVAPGARLCVGDSLRVRERSRAAVLLRSEAILRLDQNTTVTFTGPREPRGSWLELLRGAAHFLSRVTRGLTVRTPFVNGTVEGTEFLVQVTDDHTVLTVFEGRVAAENPAGRLLLAGGQSAIARAGAAPVPHVVVRPRDAVQWALHYPTVVDYRPEDFAVASAARRSVEAYRAGDLEAAFERLDPPPADPRVLAYRATLLLAVGRADEARADLDRALGLAPAHAEALALRSVIALAQNEREEALARSQEAVAADGRSAAAHVARSYALQAALDLRGARASVEEALRLRPDDALAHARLAELRLALGDVRRALRAAERAVALDPGLARAHVVLGFARLADLDSGRAREAFERATSLDPGDPLARLGLGLAVIRRGDLEAGRRHLETAASLDPNDALVRSYLGKAYYEERRDGPAAAELATAKALDPNDPTPWFYDAIRKQSVNRPVEALQDLQRAIELNDNRAVYRSRLLLDEDLAARSASLARIYDDLGFQQRALLEASLSVTRDASSYSAHRFLAEAYAALPRHEIARVSEVLQAQLLQPLTVDPVRPTLAASQLLIPEATGPADPGFHEFTPLFARERGALRLSGVAGGNETRGDEVALGALWNRYALSAGQFHHETDGFRDNNDLVQDIYNLFAQARASRATSVQAELRYQETEKGDVLRFDPENFVDARRQTGATRTARLGARHAFAPQADLLASFIYQNADGDLDLGPIARFSTPEEGYTGEATFLFRSRRLGVVLGGGHFESELVDETEIPAIGFFARTETRTHHSHGYVYSTVSPFDALSLTIGLAAESLDSGTRERDRLNPKLGAIWAPLEGTTLRAAAFRTLKRRLLNNQTLEPTQVAGFNQFFDEINATDAWRYGFGVDQRLGARLFGGVELSRRNADVPFDDLSVTPPVERRADSDEELARAYLYLAPASWVTLSVEYRYERLDRDRPLEEGIAIAETHRVPLTVSLFHRLGVRGRATVTLVDQRGQFLDAAGAPQPGEDRFWVVDASIGYRLPKRYGLVTVEARNLLDEEFRFQDTDPARPEVSPERLLLVRFTIEL